MGITLFAGIVGQHSLCLAEFRRINGYGKDAVVRHRPSWKHNGSAQPKTGSSAAWYPVGSNLDDGALTDVGSLHRLVRVTERPEVYDPVAQSHVGVSLDRPVQTADSGGLDTPRLTGVGLNPEVSAPLHLTRTPELLGAPPTPRTDALPLRVDSRATGSIDSGQAATADASGVGGGSCQTVTSRRDSCFARRHTAERAPLDLFVSSCRSVDSNGTRLSSRTRIALRTARRRPAAHSGGLKAIGRLSTNSPSATRGETGLVHARRRGERVARIVATGSPQDSASDHERGRWWWGGMSVGYPPSAPRRVTTGAGQAVHNSGLQRRGTLSQGLGLRLGHVHLRLRQKAKRQLRRPSPYRVSWSSDDNVALLIISFIRVAERRAMEVRCPVVCQESDGLIADSVDRTRGGPD